MRQKQKKVKEEYIGVQFCGIEVHCMIICRIRNTLKITFALNQKECLETIQGSSVYFCGMRVL